MDAAGSRFGKNAIAFGDVDYFVPVGSVDALHGCRADVVANVPVVVVEFQAALADASCGSYRCYGCRFSCCIVCVEADCT